jgi:hypothetical protein
MATLSEVLKSLAAENAEEHSILQSILGIAQSLVSRGGRGLALASLGTIAVTNPGIPQLLGSLPEEARTQFFGLVEALEIYQSTHGAAATLHTLNESAVTELRKIRDICLQGGTHAYY